MSDKSKVPWTDTTWNLVSGCTKESAGCANCYAERMTARLKAMGQAKYAAGFDVVKTHPSVLAEPLRWRKPRRIFVCSMSDLFHPDVPFEFIDEAFGVMAACQYLGKNARPGHTFQVLTKRAARMAAYLSEDRRKEWARWAVYHGGGIDPDGIHDQTFYGPRALPNVHLGVTAESQATADERIHHLLECPAAVRWVSIEPMIGPIDLTRVIQDEVYRIDALTGDVYEGCDSRVDRGCVASLDWVVAGGESGPGARPTHPDWAESLRDQCAQASVPFNWKQWGEWAPNCLCGSKRPHPTIDRPQPGLPGVMFRCGKSRAGRKIWNRATGAHEIHDAFPRVTP